MLMWSSLIFVPVLNFHMLSVDLYVNRTQSLPSYGQRNKVYPSQSMHPEQTTSRGAIKDAYCDLDTLLSYLIMHILHMLVLPRWTPQVVLCSSMASIENLGCILLNSCVPSGMQKRKTNAVRGFT